MPNHFKFDIKNDFLYIRGFKKGFLEGYEESLNKARAKRVERFIIHTELKDDFIASVLDVPIELVQETRKKLATKKPKNGN